QRVADFRNDPADGDAGVLHRHEFLHVARVEGPGVDHLLTLGVDDLYRLPPPQARGFAFPGRNLNSAHLPHSLFCRDLLGVRPPLGALCRRRSAVVRIAAAPVASGITASTSISMSSSGRARPLTIRPVEQGKTPFSHLPTT